MTIAEADMSVKKAREALSRAMEFHTAGDIDRAQECYREVLDHQYRVPDILPLLAGIAALKGDTEAAISWWTDLLLLKPDHVVALLEKGGLLLRRGERAEAIACFETAAAVAPENPLVLNNLSVALVQADRHHEALNGFRRLASLQPESVMPRHQVRRLTSRIVPFWHIPMLNDIRRNEAFDAAIVKAVAERGADAQILDIGTGSGLLSMMAARAGAKTIVTCEAVPVIAEMAERIIDRNGFADHIAVVNKVSTDLVVGQDLMSRADILISEVLSSDLLAEDVLSTFEDAHARLINEDAIIIPRAATAVGCLVESDVLEDYCFVDEVSGFDVSAFSALSTNRLPVHGTMTSWRRLSPDMDLQRIDLTRGQHAEELRHLEIPIIADGVATGIVQWMKIDLAEGVEFSNHPNDYYDGGWLQVLHPFPAPVKVQQGSTFSVIAGHDRNSLVLMPATAEETYA